MSDERALFDVGDVLIWTCPTHSTNIHRWRVLSICLGAIGQESLIEVESLTHSPGGATDWGMQQRLFVPEVLLRDLPFDKAERGWKELA